MRPNQPCGLRGQRQALGLARGATLGHLIEKAGALSRIKHRAGHGIVPSGDFEKVMEQLRLALEALDKATLPDNVVQFPQPARV
jgi:hypothetical protein